jgi:NADH:ubiquinone oxidoreductase subunit 3 (subunit A)
MIYIGDHLAFWAFTFIEIGFLAFAIIAARLLSPKKPNKIKATIYECGQDPVGEARSYRMLGITRYFGYAVVFFALDAFAWVVLTAAMSISVTLSRPHRSRILPRRTEQVGEIRCKRRPRS